MAKILIIERKIEMKKILIVDDSSGIREILKLLLNSKYLVKEAENGQEALDKISAENFDLVISDIEMPPGISGIEIAERIKKDFPDLPLIIMSGVIGSYKEQISSLGVSFLNKPFLLKEVTTKIKKALSD